MRALLFGALLLYVLPSTAMEVTPLNEDGQLGVAISGVKFPDGLPKDLASGLTNRLLMRVSLLNNSQVVEQRDVEISIKYDLWDEQFRVTQNSGQAPPSTATYGSAQDVVKFLSTLRLARLFATGSVGRTDVTVRIEMLLNPIERERVDKIRKWVADNSTYLPGDAGNFESGKEPSARSNALFNKIFEQYFAGADVAAVWKEIGTSRAFRIQDLNAR